MPIAHSSRPRNPLRWSSHRRVDTILSRWVLTRATAVEIQNRLMSCGAQREQGLMRCNSNEAFLRIYIQNAKKRVGIWTGDTWGHQAHWGNFHPRIRSAPYYSSTNQRSCIPHLAAAFAFFWSFVHVFQVGISEQDWFPKLDIKSVIYINTYKYTLDTPVGFKHSSIQIFEYPRWYFLPIMPCIIRNLRTPRLLFRGSHFLVVRTEETGIQCLFLYFSIIHLCRSML